MGCINIAYNMDCMEGMKDFPDKYFDLAVVDPPYGGGCSQSGNVERERELTGGAAEWDHKKRGRFGGRFNRYTIQAADIQAEGTGGGWNEKHTGGPDKITHWDIAPGPEYFRELARVSKNQIIWGGNYFGLPPTRCFLVWKKLTISEGFTMAMAEYAWTSFNDNAKVFEYAPHGNTERRMHPTQKPIALYRWIYKLYAKPGFKILDTHLGSGSSRIAAYEAGLDFVGYELDKDYFRMEEERFAKHTMQENLFLNLGL